MDRTLRTSAILIQAITIDQFLEVMPEITSAAGDPHKKYIPQHFKGVKAQVPANAVVNKSASPKKDKIAFCVYCKNKGHLQADCWDELTMDNRCRNLHFFQVFAASHVSDKHR
jgi:hypothetical protein